MKKAAFSLKEYMFDKVKIDFAKKTSNELDIDFNPYGVFKANESVFELKFVFNAHNGNIENSFVEIQCIANFKFEDNITFEEIPSYFFRNSIAILFPYVRAFISTVTLQANISPVILPTMNLSELEKPLKENTRQE